MIAYLDTSAVLQVLFRQPGVLESFGHWEKAYSSELMKVEARRVIDRFRLGGGLDDRGVARAHDPGGASSPHRDGEPALARIIHGTPQGITQRSSTIERLGCVLR